VSLGKWIYMATIDLFCYGMGVVRWVEEGEREEERGGGVVCVH